jgi:hypothetical protein
LKKWFIVSLVLFTACSGFFKKKTERILAKVHDEYLYESDLKGIIPAGTPAKDSVILAASFVENWVKQRLIIDQAKNNLTGEQMDFSRQLEDYNNSLIVYEYENALVRQKLDTIVTDEEIESYYDSNQQNFLLKDNIIQMQYIKLPLRSAAVKQFRKLLISDNTEDRNKLADQCEKFASDYFLDDQNWLLFNDLLKQIPIKTYNQEEFLKNHREVEYQDSAFIYLVKIKDFKIKEGVSPLSFEKDRIKNIILNKRKIDLINKMHQDVYENAGRHNEFEVYR